MSDRQLQQQPSSGTEDISAFVEELLSSIEQAPPARVASARFAAAAVPAQVARPCSAPAARNHLLSPRSACVSRDCAMNPRNISMEQSSGKAEGTADRLCMCAELQTGHAAKWRAHFTQHKSGKQASSCRSLTNTAPPSGTPAGTRPPPVSCPPSPSPGTHSPKVAQPVGAPSLTRPLPEPQTTIAAAAATTAPHNAATSNARRGRHILRSACQILGRWALAPALIVFAVFLAVSLLPPSLYTQPSSITCLVRGQEQACAAVLDAAVTAAQQEPPGWMRFVLATKWVLQDYASRLQVMLPPVCQAHAPPATAAAEPQQGATAPEEAVVAVTASGPHSTNSSIDPGGSLASVHEAGAGHAVAEPPADAAAPDGASGTTASPQDSKQPTDTVASGTQGAAVSQPSSPREASVFVCTPRGTNAPQVFVRVSGADMQRCARAFSAAVQCAAGGSVSGRGGGWCRIRPLYVKHHLCPAVPGLQSKPAAVITPGIEVGRQEVAASSKQEGDEVSRQTTARTRRAAQDPIQAAPLVAATLVGVAGLAALVMLPRLAQLAGRDD